MAFGSASAFDLLIRIKADAKKLESELGRASGSMGGMAKAAQGLKMGFQVAAAGITAFVATTVGILKVLDKFAQATETVNKALLGLDSVAAYKLGSETLPMVKQAAIDLTQDGLMSIADAATGLKNLLMRGFGLEESIELMNRFKDAAAFGRQGSLEFGQAIVTATEGLKNENSILVDNAGVTKNVSMMWKDYAKQIGVGVNELTKAQKREAELAGIREETNAQLGDAARLTETYSGQVSKLKQTWFEVKAELGEAVIPAFRDLADIVSKMLEKIKEHKEEIKLWIRDWLDGIKEIVKWLIKMAGYVEKLSGATRISEEEARKYIETQKKLPPHLEHVMKLSSAYAKVMGELNIAYDAVSRGSDELKEKYNKLKELYGSSAIAVRLLKDGKSDEAEELKKLITVIEKEHEATIELSKATDEAEKSSKKFGETTKETTKQLTQQEWRIKYLGMAYKDIGLDIEATGEIIDETAGIAGEVPDILEDIRGTAATAGASLEEAAKKSLFAWEELADGIQTKLADAFAQMLSGAESFTDALKGLWEAIKESFFQMIGQMIAKWVVNFIGNALGSLMNAITGKGGVNEAINSIGPAATQAATTAAGAFGNISGAAGSAASSVGNLLSLLGQMGAWLGGFSLLGSWLSEGGSPLGQQPPGQFHESPWGGGGAPPGKWGGSGFQHGGMVTRPTLAMIGENPALNPEFIFNRPQMQALMTSRGITIESGAIVISGYNRNPRDLANEIFDVLTQKIKMNWRGL